MDGKKISHTEPMQAKDYTEAAASIFSWLKTKETHRTKRHSTHRDKGRPRRQKLFRSHKNHTRSSARDPQLRAPRAAAQQKLTGIIRADPSHYGETPLYAVFRHSLHRTTPDVASLYAIPTGLAQKHNIRRLPQELFDEVLDSVSGRG
jgi:hypothetical protein